MFDLKTLVGKYVKLEPINKEHTEGLVKVVEDGKLWELFVTLVPTIAEINTFIENAINAHAQGDGLTFVIVDKTTNEIIGSTRFMKANLPYKKTEIGYTFLRKSHQKTKVNTEAKLLMLTYAFEELRLNRVELLTDFFNQNSQKAILRLGAKQEGILRNHMIMPNGRVRDSVLFSIIENEWMGVKQNLIYKLNK